MIKLFVVSDFMRDDKSKWVRDFSLVVVVVVVDCIYAALSNGRLESLGFYLIE